MVCEAFCANAHKVLLSPGALVRHEHLTRLQHHFQIRSSLHSHSFNFNNSAKLIHPLRFRISCLSTLSYDGNGGRGGRDDGFNPGGADGWNSPGGGGGDKMSFLSWYLVLLGKYPVLVKALTSALLTLIGDMFCQLVIDKEQPLDLKRTFVFTFLSFALVGPTLHFCIVKKLGPINTLPSSVLWVFGFYWILAGGQALLGDSLQHCWLTVFSPAFDVLFIISHIGMACIVFSVFYLIPVIARAYAMRLGEGASEEDIRSLPKYRFSQSNSLVMVNDNENQHVKSRADCHGSHMSELSLHPDDSECCICLCAYVDGAELYRLPCTHHFHCGCISRWLRTKATCPLCKFNIRRGDTLI